MIYKSWTLNLLYIFNKTKVVVLFLVFLLTIILQYILFLLYTYHKTMNWNVITINNVPFVIKCNNILLLYNIYIYIKLIHKFHNYYCYCLVDIVVYSIDKNKTIVSTQICCILYPMFNCTIVQLFMYLFFQVNDDNYDHDHEREIWDKPLMMVIRFNTVDAVYFRWRNQRKWERLH